jgi:type II secretory pathway predicted ATPase ExeA
MYEAHFGLTESPFHIAPDLRFFVETAPHRAAIETLRQGFAHGDEFLLLTGDFGTGKTIVARRLFEEAPRERDLVGQLTSQRIEGDELFERIAEVFEIAEFEPRHPLVALTRALERHGRDGRDVWLLIDESHRLDVHSLRRLRKLTGVRAGARGVLHVLLVGRHAPAGIAELQKIGRPLAVGTHVVLGGLDEAGSREYVRRRLERAGWSGRPSFDDEALAEIHARCDGNPGRIHRLGGHVLLQLHMKGLDAATQGFIRAVDELIASEFEDGGEVPADGAGSESRLEAEDSNQPPSIPPKNAAPIEFEIPTAEAEPSRPALREQMPVPVESPVFPSAPPRSRAQAWWVQALAGVLIFISGGLTWQALWGRGDAAPLPARATAAGHEGIGAAPSAQDAADALSGYEDAQRPAPSAQDRLPSPASPASVAAKGSCTQQELVLRLCSKEP